jgi:hypothetical protein
VAGQKDGGGLASKTLDDESEVAGQKDGWKRKAALNDDDDVAGQRCWFS